MACGNHEFNIEDCRDCWFISGIKHEFFSFEDVESFEGRRMLRDAAHGAIRSYKNTNEFAGITNFFKDMIFWKPKPKIQHSREACMRQILWKNRTRDN